MPKTVNRTLPADGESLFNAEEIRQKIIIITVVPRGINISKYSKIFDLEG